MSQAEIAALDRGHGVEADRLELLHRMLADALLRVTSSDHRLGDALDGEVAGDRSACRCRPDFTLVLLKPASGELGDIEEIRAFAGAR
jgi:hypothetical protein